MSCEAVRVVSGGIELRVHAQPKASKTEFCGLHGDRLKVRVQAPPVEGAANEALCGLVARTAGVSRSRVEVFRGRSSRDKDVRVLCDDPADALRRVCAAAGVGES